MGVLLRPNGAPATKVRENLSREEVKRVVEFDAWCRQRGLRLDLFCAKCVDEHGPNGRTWANNDRYATEFKIECLHAERVYGRGDVEGPRAPQPEKKIIVGV
jgi:hypothetical protein